MRKILCWVLLTFTLNCFADPLARTNWFDSSGLLIATPGHLQMTFTNQEQFWTTYFAPTNAPITLSQPGNQLRLTWAFLPHNIFTFNTQTPLAIALTFTPDTLRLTNDATPFASGYPGYAQFMGAYAGDLFSVNYLASREDTINPSQLFRSDYPGRNGWSVQTGSGNNGISSAPAYTLTMTITRNQNDGLDVAVIIMAGANVVSVNSFTDAIPASFSFNTANIYSEGALSGAIDTTGFDVEFFQTSPPDIFSQPVSFAATLENAVTFSVTADGAMPLSYQWTFNTQNIIGETNATLTLTNVQPEQAGTYAVIIANFDGTNTSSNAVLTVSPPSPCVPAPPGLLAWWPADGNALDIVGRNNGTLENAVGYGNRITGGQCFVISDSYSGIDVGPCTNLQLQDFTIEAWMQRADTNGASRYGGTGILFGFGAGYALGIHDNGTLLLSKVGEDEVDSTATVTDMNWHHVAVTKSSTNVIFYIDGNAGAAVNYTNVFVFAGDALIGAASDPSAGSFYGGIDDIAVYNRALRAAEIQTLSQSPGGKCQNTPRLAILPAKPATILKWPVWAAGFNLQSLEGSLSSNGKWTNALSALATNGFEISTTVPISGGSKFFRLNYPRP